VSIPVVLDGAKALKDHLGDLNNYLTAGQSDGLRRVGSGGAPTALCGKGSAMKELL
jgi:hypothetical protein